MKLPKLRRPPLAVVICILVALLIGGGVLAFYLNYRAHTPIRFSAVDEGVLYRSGQPTGNQYDVLKRRNIRTIVNLRHKDENTEETAEEKAVCEATGVEYVYIPVTKLFPDRAETEAFLRIARNPSKTPVLVHCQYGRSRTGYMVAAYRIVVQGWPHKKALDEMFAKGWNGKDHVEKGTSLLNEMETNRQAWLAKTAPSAQTMPTTQPAGGE